MKITSFNPQIITRDADVIIEMFKDLGFEIRHDQEGIGELGVEGIRMKDSNGFYLDISQPEIELTGDVTAIRMNVDNFDEAYQLLTERGFKNFYKDKIVEAKSSKSTLMLSPSGFIINLVQHIK